MATRDQRSGIYREPALIAIIFVIFVLLGLFILYPVFSVLRLSLTANEGVSGEVYRSIFEHPRYFRSIRNSVVLGVIVATTATIIGFIMAYAVERLRIPGRSFFRTMAILPIISPPFMFALSVILLFGRNGLITAHLLTPTVLFFAVQKRILSRRSYTMITGKSARRSTLPIPPVAKYGFTAFAIILTPFVILLYGTIISGSFINLWGVDWSFTLKHFVYSWDVGATTMWRTLFLALVSTPITAFLGMGIAFLVVRKRFVGRHLMELLAMLSYAIPGTAIGIGYVLAFNGVPFRLSGTAFILITAYVFRNVPISVEGGIAALKQISAEIEESSTNLGATSSYTFCTVTLPLIKPAFFAGATFALVRAMTAISAIIFLVSARWNHMTVLILAQTEILRLGAASVMSFALIVVIMTIIFGIMKLTGLNRNQIFGATPAK